MTRLGRTIGAAAGAAFLATLSSAAWADDDRYAAIVVDVATHEILHADQADEQRYPASLTKMMTLYLVFEALERGDITLSDRIVASRFASRQPPSRLGVRRGESLTVDQAIRALAVNSANDVAVMVAERLAGSEARFAARMTTRARALGMNDTRFANASGLPNPNIRTTARDMATLSLALFNDFPEYWHYFQTPTNTWRSRTARNHNRLLGSVTGVDGIKTGYTRASGYNLATSAERDGRRIITVVLGGATAASRDAQVAYLVENAYEELERRRSLQTNPDVALTALPTLAVNGYLTPRAEGGTAVAVTQTFNDPRSEVFVPAPDSLGQGDLADAALEIADDAALPSPDFSTADGAEEE
ncbi:MAG: D-alanyl-D-alanine carboxypeptidase family protein [Hyphomonadaceae bacterium]|nr:D-alanyl-D-alanine carboxypeptidase family protein [Hyphomonadaceae bacterium]